jgi:uncharacterized membrane protein YgaE (UPF0421/DUF939 family)
VSLNRSFILVIAALVCFAIGLLLAINVISSGNQEAWLFGGLLAFAASFLP